MGAVEALQPEEESPFVLGQVAGGKSQLAVDAAMFRSPAFSYGAASSDFLVHCDYIWLTG